MTNAGREIDTRAQYFLRRSLAVIGWSWREGNAGWWISPKMEPAGDESSSLSSCAQAFAGYRTSMTVVLDANAARRDWATVAFYSCGRG